METFTTLSVEARDHLLVVGLNRPGKRNAFDLTMLGELAQAYGLYERDPALRCLVLFAHGDHFTAGLDLAEVGPAVAAGAPLFPEGGIDPLDLADSRRSKPVVMAVQGFCLTIGVELLLAADIRLAAEGTRFRQMEVQRGILPFGGGTLRWPQVAGWGDAMRWLLTGDEFDAAEALRIGLVQEVVPREALLERALWIAGRVAAQAPLAVQATRAAALRGLEGGRRAGIEGLVDEARRLMDTQDAREGLRSFLERRPARFVGR
jgi:enoyl-CoA hydratase/carnithine racemase